MSKDNIRVIKSVQDTTAKTKTLPDNLIKEALAIVNSIPSSLPATVQEGCIEALIMALKRALDGDVEEVVITGINSKGLSYLSRGGDSKTYGTMAVLLKHQYEVESLTTLEALGVLEAEGM